MKNKIKDLTKNARGLVKRMRLDELWIPFNFFLFSVVLIISSQYHAHVGQRSLSWPSTQGEVIGTHVEKWIYPDKTSSRHSMSSRSTTKSVLIITYRYQVKGKGYANNRYDIGAEDENAYDRENPKEWGEKHFPTGKQVRVFYDPENPEVAALKTGIAVRTFVLLAIGSLLSGVGYFFLRLVMRSNAPEGQRPSLLIIILTSVIIVAVIGGINILALPEGLIEQLTAIKF